ncbi:chorismate synthase [Candidatus Aerophobetes bacterium]|uniref:Chorismate synthase n=1 Tax=Aerophobetes bacterium TaxID=2030807 RepID=A0A2A4WZW4_UNCAE|nr:MAG: chorismate synthase [Candidatus Aerophobetes bacterium]
MGNNSFGKNFVVTTWGESHGKAMGVVIDGCPPNLPLSLEDIHNELHLRSPSRNKTSFTTPRKEEDKAEILSGVFEGKTTGAPISIIIYNKDARPSDYKSIESIYRPGHANFTYEKKYGHFDPRGGGRASARETAARVAAGAVAKKWLQLNNIKLVTYLSSVGEIQTPNIEISHANVEQIQESILNSAIFCPDKEAEVSILNYLEEVSAQGDSMGSTVQCHILGVNPGVGDPIYRKIEAKLASAMLSINACKGFEMGSGFQAASMYGSEHNDLFVLSSSGQITCSTNHAGGVLAGISTGMPITMRAAFKPPSTIKKPQQSLNKQRQTATLCYGTKARHDVCLGIRAVPVVQAMAALTIIDFLLA